MQVAAPNILALRGDEAGRNADIRLALRIKPRLVFSVLLLASVILGMLDLVTLAAESEIGCE